jgi:hypothetical protein
MSLLGEMSTLAAPARKLPICAEQTAGEIKNSATASPQKIDRMFISLSLLTMNIRKISAHFISKSIEA